MVTLITGLRWYLQVSVFKLFFFSLESHKMWPLVYITSHKLLPYFGWAMFTVSRVSDFGWNNTRFQDVDKKEKKVFGVLSGHKLTFRNLTILSQELFLLLYLQSICSYFLPVMNLTQMEVWGLRHLPCATGRLISITPAKLVNPLC